MINFSLKWAAAVAMLAGVSVGANAETKDVGIVDFSTPTSFNGYVLGGGSTGLNDIIRFTPEGETISSGFSVMDFPITLSNGDNGDNGDNGNNGSFGLELATVTLSSTGNDGIVGGGDDMMLKTAAYSDFGNTNDHISFSYDQPLAANEYYLHIAGVTSGTLGGAYNGSIEVSPIPEPESFAMLLAGLGLMGAVVRRRSMNKTA